MTIDTDYDEVTLAMSLPQDQREAILRAIEFARNPTEQNSEYVCEVIETLFQIKSEMKKQNTVKKQIDDVIKFAIRKHANHPVVKQYFKVAPPIHKYKIENPLEMLNRLLQLFDDPLDFASCIDFNFRNLRDLMGDDFIKQNSDIISDSEYMPAVYLQK